MQVRCLNCNRPTNHAVMACYTEKGAEDFQWRSDYEILRCQGCGKVSFGIRSSDEDSRASHEPESLIYYPSREVGRQPIFGRLFRSHVPTNVLRIYHEVITAINNNQPLLTAVGLRLLIEAICKEEKCKGNLEKEIDGLVAKGIIAAKQAKLLHKHRFLGNNAAHEISAPPQEELIAALDMAEIILRAIYSLEPLGSRITSTNKSARRAAREKKKQFAAKAARILKASMPKAQKPTTGTPYFLR